MKWWCFFFGHKWYVLDIGHGKIRRISPTIISRKMYWHWRCETCGLTQCCNRFYRHTNEQGKKLD